MDKQRTLGELVRKKRIEKSWTQEKLSTELGVNYRYLQKIEADHQIPSLTTIFKLASVLGMTPDKLIMPIWKEWQKEN